MLVKGFCSIVICGQISCDVRGRTKNEKTKAVVLVLDAGQ